MSQLGAQELLHLGLGDDQHDLGFVVSYMIKCHSSRHKLKLFNFYSPDAVIDPWLKSLWEKILTKIPLPPGKNIMDFTTK